MRIGVLGHAMLDTICYVREYPPRGGIAYIKSQKTIAAGTAVNFALFSERLGLEVYLIAKIAKDSMGKELLDDIKKRSVKRIDMGGLVRVSPEHGSTGRSFIVIDEGGQRTIFTWMGISKDLTLNELKKSRLLRSIKHLHISAFSLLEDPLRSTSLCLIEDASKNISTSIDIRDIREISSERYGGDVKKMGDKLIGLLKRLQKAGVKIVFLSKLVADVVSKEELEKSLPLSMILIIYSEENKGCWIRGPRSSELKFVPPINVEVKNLLGANDAFVAAFLAEYLRYSSVDKAAIYANACKALRIERGVDFIPTDEDVRKLIQA